MLKLQRIDELTRPEHSFLDEDDECLFLREYTAGAGYTYGETNNLISNLKKKMDRRGRPEWTYKEQAIKTAGRELRKALKTTLEKHRDHLTIVPMPPSLTKGNALYDDRMRQIVDIVTRGLGCDVRELVVQTRDMQAAHLIPSGSPRPRPEDWFAVYEVDETLAIPPPRNILVLDDVLTVGAHFVGIKRRLRERFPELGKVIGCFYARRAVQTSPTDE